MARDILTRNTADYRGLSDEDMLLLCGERGITPESEARPALIAALLATEIGDVVEIQFQEPGAPHTFIRATGTFLYVEGDEPEKPKAAKPKRAKKLKAKKPKATRAKVVVLGNGYYQVGDQKFHGKKKLEEAGYAVP